MQILYGYPFQAEINCIANLNGKYKKKTGLRLVVKAGGAGAGWAGQTGDCLQHDNPGGAGQVDRQPQPADTPHQSGRPAGHRKGNLSYKILYNLKKLYFKSNFTHI